MQSIVKSVFFCGENMPKVSVIIPVYNVEKYLPACLNSILNQTLKDIEIICVNDGSTDNSLKVLNAYTEKYPDIRVVSQPNQGLSAARNAGIEVASGDYLYFIDSDDFLHPQCLELVHGLAEKHHVPLVAFDLLADDGSKKFSLRKAPTWDINDMNETVTSNPLKYLKKSKTKSRIWNSACLKLFRRDLFDNLRFEPGIYFEDMVLTCKMLRDKPKTVIIPNKMYYYRTNPNSIMRSNMQPKHMDSYCKAFEIILDHYSDEKYAKERAIVMKSVIPLALEEIVNQLDNSDLRAKRKILPMWRDMLSSLARQKVVSWDAIKDKGRGILDTVHESVPVAVPVVLSRDLLRTSRKEYAKRHRWRSRHRN